MSRILRRPMFRGGRVDSYGTGIASGLADGGMPNKRGLVDGPGGYAGVMDIYESVKEQIPERNTQGLSRGDYLRIASAGLDILGAPGETGGILGGTLSAASKPLSKLGVDLGTSMDARQESELDRREELARTLTGAQVEYDVGMEKAKGETGRRKILLETITETKKENVTNDTTLSEDEKTKKLNEIQAKYDSDLEFYVFQGGDVSDYFKLGSNTELIKVASRSAKKAIKGAIGSDGKPITPDHPEYNSTLSTLQAQYLATLTKEFAKQFAEGGAVTEDVNIMTETPTSMTDVNVEETVNPEKLSYDEIRARLPKEIGDDIVTLLANSYQALGDFAQIRTQTDVDQFNQKYQVQLVLPQEA
tara:strand:- start:466 stop:1548 length:1083 start_codon:yes stop_codon:yes gene_type:complete